MRSVIYLYKMQNKKKYFLIFYKLIITEQFNTFLLLNSFIFSTVIWSKNSLKSPKDKKHVCHDIYASM